MKAQRSNLVVLGIMSAAALGGLKPAMAQPELVGEWGSVLDNTTGWESPGVHTILLKNKDLLVFDSLGDVRVWRSASEAMGPTIPRPLDSDLLPIVKI